MRITTSAVMIAAAMSVLAPAIAVAQDQPQQSQQNFGPRVKPAQPGQQPAQGAQPAQPQSETVATHGAWQIQCGNVPAQGNQAARKQCGMIQLTKSEKNEKVALSLIILKAKQGDKDVTMMRVMAPIGVYLPTGVALEIDKAAVGRVPFTRCMPRLCEAFAEASPPTLEKMKKGTSANFIIYEAPGIGIPLKISLEGFSAALDDLNKL